MEQGIAQLLLHFITLVNREEDEVWVTCDLAFVFSEECESVAARESAVGRGTKKERLIQLLHVSAAAPCLLTRCYLVSSLSCF